MGREPALPPVRLDGAALFGKFVTQENQQNTLLFYFAVEGYKKDRPNNERTELAKIIHRKFVKLNGEASVDVSPIVRTKVAEAIRNSAISPGLFDSAQQEVERCIRETSYPMFLKSDLYVQYVSNGGISPTRRRVPVQAGHIYLRGTCQPYTRTQNSLMSL
ncbi:putative axin-1 [Apostichopus japonicus]|uniref:Putative axin-1 n=1 Tax=Stichopus japonicus TaxID=307972 RepID=A0A2G8LJP5_STIJA|nr:putative axin-1 [Apostichopus japonicus]